MTQCPKCYRNMTPIEECGFCGHRTALPPARSEPLLGLSVTHEEDACWMRFKASNGKEALIDLLAYAKDRGNITRSAIEQWIEDVRPNIPLCVNGKEGNPDA